MNALVVDDSSPTRLILSRMLQQLGFAVNQAVCGTDGLQRLHEGEPPDVVLVDWHMPDMDGGQFVRQVRTDRRYAEVRLLLVTGEEDQTQLNAALRDGADGCLRKPFNRDKMMETLKLLDLPMAVG
jgi:two-component system chemotaxis response regulator CheY